MNEYRTTLELDQDTDYTFVEMGPIPGLPSWHCQSQPSRFPFPKERAAFRFADRHKQLQPDRKVTVATTDGKRFEL